MNLFWLLLLVLFLSPTQIHALPAATESNGITKPILRRTIGGFFSAIPNWFRMFSFDEDVRVVDFFGSDYDHTTLGTMECESDPEWRTTGGGYCQKPGRYFPRDTGVMPNAMDPEYLPGVHRPFWLPPPGQFDPIAPLDPIDWEPTDLDPIHLGDIPYLTPGDATVPNGPLSGGRASGPDRGSNPESGDTVYHTPLDTMPGGSSGPGGSIPPGSCGGPGVENPGVAQPKGIPYTLRSGEIYVAPPGSSEIWLPEERVSFYRTICVADVAASPGDPPPPQPPLLEAAGLEVCDQVEGSLFDELDRLEEMEELMSGDSDWQEKLINKVNDWQSHPDFGVHGDVANENVTPGSQNPEDMTMAGGLGPADTPESAPESLSSLDSIRQGPRYQRGYRRMVRHVRQWMRRRNANGFFDPEATRHLNAAFGLDNDPIASGPGPEDDPALTRLSAQEKLESAIASIASMPYVPLILPEGYSWIPAKKAEFGDNLEAVLRFAQLMGRDPMQKAIPTPPVLLDLPIRNYAGDAYAIRLLGLMGATQGTAITPEILANFHWRIKTWTKINKEKALDLGIPPWLKKVYLDPVNKGWKLLFPKKWRKTQWIWAGIVGGTWGLIQGLHSAHDKKMEELQVPHQKWDQAIQEGKGPWYITEKPITTTIDGTVQVSTLTEYTQYFPGSTVPLTPSEIAELLGPVLTVTASTTTGTGEMTAAPPAAAATTPAVITQAAPEYAGIAPLPAVTVIISVPTTVMVDAKPTPEPALLNYVTPERLVNFGELYTRPDGTVEVDDDDEDVSPDPPLPSASPTYRPRPVYNNHHGAYTNGTFANVTAGAVNSTDSANSTDAAGDDDSSPAANTTDDQPYQLPTHNYTAVVTHSTRPKEHNKAHHNVTSLGNFPNGTSSASSSSSSSGRLSSQDLFFANGTRADSNSTYGFRNGNGTDGTGNGTAEDRADLVRAPKPWGKVRYLTGSAPWGGVVVPEVPDAVPVGEGRWMCAWAPRGA